MISVVLVKFLRIGVYVAQAKVVDAIFSATVSVPPGCS